MDTNVQILLARGIIHLYLDKKISIQEYSKAISSITDDEWGYMVMSEIEKYYTDK